VRTVEQAADLIDGPLYRPAVNIDAAVRGDLTRALSVYLKTDKPDEMFVFLGARALQAFGLGTFFGLGEVASEEAIKFAAHSFLGLRPCLVFENPARDRKRHRAPGHQ
jgi:hypothetical protein